MEQIISIDFGNSYTKVSIREHKHTEFRQNQFNAARLPHKETALARVLKDDSLKWDDDHICIPTAVVRVREEDALQHFYGSQIDLVTEFQEKEPTTEVLRNWKPLFFDGNGGPTGAASSRGQSITNISAGFDGQEESDLSARYWQWLDVFRAAGGSPKAALSFDQWQAVVRAFDAAANASDETPSDRYWTWTEAFRRSGAEPQYLLSFEHWQAIRGSFTQGACTKVGRPGVASNASVGVDIDEIALGFFSWLLRFTQQTIDPSGAIAVDKISTRITLPSFGHQQAAETRLGRLLSTAGWRCDSKPVVHEPFANAIGLFTEGRSTWFRALNTGIEDLHLGEMFKDAPILQAMRGRQQNSDTYWVLTIDIGGYTTDFFMLGFDLRANAESIFPDPSSPGNRLVKESFVGGVQDIDKRIGQLLPEAKQPNYMRLLNAAKQVRLERYHVVAYRDLNSVVLGPAMNIFETEPERAVLRDTLDEFAGLVTGMARDFLAAGGYPTVDEVVLTGGGFNIPLIRDRVANYLLENYSARVVNAPLSTHKPIITTASASFREIPAKQTRAATSMGGTSILFDSIDGRGFGT